MASISHAEKMFSDKLENYLIASAKGSLKNDISAAKAWLLTAKVLYPHKFGVQFLAYQIEKTTNNMKDTAKCLADLLATFPSEPELRSEVQSMTTALRQFEEREVSLENADDLVKLFYQLPPSVQRGLLLSCANNTPDALDTCKLMLLLFRKFPGELLVYGPEVMENLITAEKHSPHSGNPLNCFRKLLVCELLPLLAQSAMEFPPQNLLRLLDRAVEFYLTYAFEANRWPRREDRDVAVIEDPWARLWEVILHLGIKLKWELTTGFTRYWSRETYFKTLSVFSNRMDEGSQRQVAFCTLIVLLKCVHEYLPIVEPGTADLGYVLVEGFCQSENGQAHASKVMKTEEDPNAPLVTAALAAPSHLVPAFLAAIRCLETLYMCEFIRREYLRLRSQWKIEQWLKTFLLDAALYQGSYEQKMLLQPRRPDENSRAAAIVSELVRLTWYYRVDDNIHAVETISKISGMLGSISAPGVIGGNQLTAVTRRQRHIHFLPVTRAAILQYCVKLLLNILKQRNSDMALGHTLVLMQLNWPAESDNLNEISELIQMRGGFGYAMFANYVINIDILERFAFLAGPNGPKLPLDIFPGSQQIHNQRRMSTRGIDKGVKEDFKMAMRAQVARWNEPVDELIIRFLKSERELIQHSLLS